MATTELSLIATLELELTNLLHKFILLCIVLYTIVYSVVYYCV